jgi:hypothetical protein
MIEFSRRQPEGAMEMLGDSYRLPEEDLRVILAQIAEICVSPEFQSLRHELETIYQRAEADNAGVAAFQDALYTLLIQNERIVIGKPRLSES